MAVDETKGSLKRRQQKANKELGNPKDGSANGQITQVEKSRRPGKTHRSTETTAVAATVLSPVIATSLALIFGGCCSNVYALEAIVSLSSGTGTLITFLQFLLTSLYTIPSQLTTEARQQGDKSRFFPRLRPRIIPLHKWLIYTAFFVTINILNNAVFNYQISIPLHIILRSASPVTSMLVGYIFVGRRYTTKQIVAVLLLFAGVVLAAISDANAKSLKTVMEKVEDGATLEAKVKSVKATLVKADVVNQLPGFVFLFSALVLSALMGLYTDKIYDEHGRSLQVTNENLFYSHTLSLPWFVIQANRLKAEFTDLIAGASAVQSSNFASSIIRHLFFRFPKLSMIIPAFLRPFLEESTLAAFSLLLVNALTQIVCITGVNRLSTETTSLTVTIVLNIRKLVSLLVSIWLFGNSLSAGVVLGAIMVFIGGGMYGLGGKKRKTA